MTPKPSCCRDVLCCSALTVQHATQPGGLQPPFSDLVLDKSVHVQNKPLALRNVVDSLRSSGCLVLSIDHASDSLDFGDWRVDLHPWAPQRYAEVLASVGCEVEPLVPLIDTWSKPNGKQSETYGQAIATLVKARKR